MKVPPQGAPPPALPEPESIPKPETNNRREPPKPVTLGMGQGANQGAGVPLHASLNHEGTVRDGGANMQQSSGSKTETQIGDGSRSRNEQVGQRNRRGSLGKSGAPREDVSRNDSRTTVPGLPRVPEKYFSREVMNEILDFTDRAASVALFGPACIGKSFVALTLLHHDRTLAKFGPNRYYVRCGDLSNSLEDFLVRISGAIHTDVTRLRSYLQSSPPLMLVLDEVDSILDPLAPESGDISAAIKEFGNYEHVSLVTTSRMYPDILGFHQISVPALSEEGAREAFYGASNLVRSSAVDDLVGRLDPHPLSIELVGSCVRENNWDESTFLRAWNADQMVKVNDNWRSGDAIEFVVRSPAILGLGVNARNVLEAVAASPAGVEERELGEEIDGVREVVDVLSKFSLVYRQDGFVKMFSPVRSYFLELTWVSVRSEEFAHWDSHYMPGACRSLLSLSFDQFSGLCLTYFLRAPHIY